MTFDCRTCGACCVALDPEQPFYAETTWTDERKLGPAFVRLHVLRPKFPGMSEHGMRIPHGAIKTVRRNGHAACAALTGEVGRDVACAVYSKRPRVCRSACEPGDSVCLDHRRWIGLA